MSEVIENRRRASGWAWGVTDGGKWLTVAGSAIYTAELAQTPAGAVAPPPIIGSAQTLARVERRGTWFRILELAPERDQHTLITATRHGTTNVVGWCSCATWRYDLGAHANVWSGRGWHIDVPQPLDTLRERYETDHAAALAR